MPSDSLITYLNFTDPNYHSIEDIQLAESTPYEPQPIYATYQQPLLIEDDSTVYWLSSSKELEKLDLQREFEKFTFYLEQRLLH